MEIASCSQFHTSDIAPIAVKWYAAPMAISVLSAN